MGKIFCYFLLISVLYQSYGKPSISKRDVECRPGPVELVFVVDESGSVGQNDFKKALEATINLTDSLDVGTRDTQSRVAFVLFDDTAKLAFNLDKYSTNAEVSSAIRGLATKYSGGGTNIANGMDVAIRQVFMKTARINVPRIMIIVTDGQDSSDVEAEHTLAKGASVLTYALGVGSVNILELTKATGDRNRVYSMEDYRNLTSVLNQICVEIESSVAPPVAPILSHNPKSCGCDSEDDYVNVWLDMIFILDSSSGVAERDFDNYKTLLYQIGLFYTVGQSNVNAEKYSRIAIINNAKTAVRFANLTTYKSGLELQNDMPRLKQMKGEFDPAQGLRLAQDMIDEERNARRRLNVRKVVILFSSIGIDCSKEQSLRTMKSKLSRIQTDILCRLLSKMESEKTVVVTVAMKLPAATSYPLINVGDKCSRFVNDDLFVTKLMNGLCLANCYCLHPYTQFRVNGTCTKYGECFFVHNIALSYNGAQNTCTRGNEIVPAITSQDKDNFLKELHFETTFFPYWIGMQRKTDGNFYYNNTERVSTDDFFNWCQEKNEPNYSKGDCVYSGQCTGTTTGWFMDKCGMMTPTHFFSCQKDSCSANNYCSYTETV